MAPDKEKYQKVTDTLGKVMDETSKVIVGQEDVREHLLIAMLCDGRATFGGTTIPARR